MAKKSQVSMGGPGDLQLLHAAVYLSGAKRIIETGVAYGWSSLAILSAIEKRPEAKLVSVDMPYPKAEMTRTSGLRFQTACDPSGRLSDNLTEQDWSTQSSSFKEVLTFVTTIQISLGGDDSMHFRFYGTRW